MISLAILNEKTFIFYILILFFSSISVLVKKVNIKIFNKHINLTLAIFSIMLFIVKALNLTGRDIGVPRSGYYKNFISATSFSDFLDKGVEFIFKIFTIFMRTVTDNYYLYLFVINLLTILPLIYIFNKYRKKIDLLSSITLYVTVFLFSSFSPVRQSLAASIGLLAYNCLLEKKYTKAFIWTTLATLIHSAAIVLFVPLILSVLKFINRRMVFYFAIIIFITFFVARDSVISFFSGNIRYSAYAETGTHFGLEQIAYYLPIIALVVYCKRFQTKRMVLIDYAYTFTAFCFGMLSYVFPAFGRFYISFLPLIFIVGKDIYFLKNRYPKYKLILNCIVLSYGFFRFWLFIVQYSTLQDLMPYKNMLGWHF